MYMFILLTVQLCNLEFMQCHFFDLCVRYNFTSLQHCLSAGEPINPDVMQKWREATGLDIYEGYGQTETVSYNIGTDKIKVTSSQ